MQANPLQDRIEILDSLVGIAGSRDISPDDIKLERLTKTSERESGRGFLKTQIDDGRET